MRELPLALSYLKGRPLRTIMTIMSIVIGVTIMFGLNGVAPAFEELFTSSMQSMALSEIDLYVTRRDGGFFRQEYTQNVGSVNGVAATTSMIVRSVIVPVDHYATADGRAIRRSRSTVSILWLQMRLSMWSLLVGAGWPPVVFCRPVMVKLC
jgi:hypothetical protein